MTGQNVISPVPIALRPGPIIGAWILTIGIDLFFNAGLFASLFDQAKEPGLLDDEALFRRVPVAYLALLLAVLALAWIVDRTGRSGPTQGAMLGVAAGLVFVATGLVYVWTAIEMTGPFLAAGALVQVTEMTAAGLVLGAARSSSGVRPVVVRAIGAGLVAAILGIVIQNVLA